MAVKDKPPATQHAARAFRPYVSPNQKMPEFTWSAVLLGTVLGIVFGASSLYLVLKVGMTVSASIPVAVLAITLFRVFSRAFGIRRATILENNIVQTTGSAGESIAFGVGVTIPALMLLGFDMELVRVMVVGVLGGLLGILMMIPLRRAFIVRQHGKLAYPEGTACADVLVVGEEGGATAKTVFVGFGLAFLFKFLTSGFRLWHEEPNWPLYSASGRGLRGGVIGGELSPALLGVGYIIGPRIASIMLAGGALAYLVLVPMIVLFAGDQSTPIYPADFSMREWGERIQSPADAVGELRNAYILYIGAGAVATGGIISMFQALPLIVSSIRAGLRDLKKTGPAGSETAAEVPRTEHDLPLWVTAAGSLALIAALMAVPQLGLGFTFQGAIGAALIVVFGFLFVTVSARLTGEIGSSSNPISGMTVATLLITCLVFLLLGRTDKPATLAALTVAAIVCVAASNGGTTAQDLKTGFLVGGTPKLQQIAILIGALTSALVIGGTLLLLNEAGTVYSRDRANLPNYQVPDVSKLTKVEQAGGEYAEKDKALYHVLHVSQGEIEGVQQGKYLVDDTGTIQYLVDPAINGRLKKRDTGEAVERYSAPKTRLMAIIIDGILNQKLPWGLVLIGVLIAVVLELAGVPSLPFAVGVYLPIQASVPIFIGGALRWLADRLRRTSAAEAEMSPGVLLSSGYIAGGSIAGVVVAFFEFIPNAVTAYFPSRFLEGFGPDERPVKFTRAIGLDRFMPTGWYDVNWPGVAAFSVLILLLFLVGSGKLLRSGSAEPRKVARKEEV